MAIQEQIKNTTSDVPTVTLVSSDGEEILVHREKLKKLLYFQQNISDKLKKLKLPNTLKEITQIINHIYFNQKLSSNSKTYLYSTF